MKIRYDFVTNSSSSSFVVAFDSEEDISRVLKDNNTGRYYETIYDDIKSGKITKERALINFNEEMESLAFYVILHEKERKFGSYLDAYKWCDESNYEYMELQREFIDERLKEFKKRLNGKEFIAEVEYGDHGCYELEHEIMPNLSCTVQIYNHH